MVPVRVLLLSTYELGHQPLHLAAPAGALLRAGHEVRCCDLAVDPLDDAAVSWADAVACSVPMHTAMRLARPALAAVRARRPDVPVCLYGLYANLDGAEGTTPVADLAVAGEYETPLVAWVGSLGSRGAPSSCGTPPAPHGSMVELGRHRGGLPARHLLPPLGRYARLVVEGEERLAGYVEASHGCAHRCRHCPVPVVYDGRTRLVGEDVVVADVAQLVALGARHVTFGDPDFLNGPHHARRVLSAVHGAFPALTFDVTAKVEHVLRHRPLWPELAAAGCMFVVSAFESTSDRILGELDKGHRAVDAAEAVAVLRAAGIEPRPSLVPFTPWTTADDMAELLDFVARCDLVGNVDPIQYAIRLLVPPASLLVTSGRLSGRLSGYDAEHLGWSWTSPDPRLDALHEELAAVAADAEDGGWPARRAYDAVCAATARRLALPSRCAAAGPVDGALRSPLPEGSRPRLTEAWFCCAEPRGAHMGTEAASEFDSVSGLHVRQDDGGIATPVATSGR